ncbi:MAG: hypothetical protein Fur0018_17800 [Anaerolineales bacterium]
MSIQTLTPTSRPAPHPQVILQESGEEAVLILPAQGKVKVLNSTGAFIWKKLDGTHTLEEIAQALSQEYEVSPAEALQDVLAFTATLLERGLVTV